MKFVTINQSNLDEYGHWKFKTINGDVITIYEQWENRDEGTTEIKGFYTVENSAIMEVRSRSKVLWFR